MALKKEVIEKIKAYGFDVDKLIEAAKADSEVDFEVPEFVAISQKDLDARDANKKAEGVKEGEAGAKSTFIKEAAKRLNIDFKGERIGDLVKEIETKINSSDDVKVKELTTQINLLQKDKETLTSQYESEKTRAQQAQFDAELISMFPQNRTPDLSDRERLALAKMNLTFEQLDGKLVVKRNGELVRDAKSQNPLPVDQVVKDFFTEKKWINDGTAATGANPPANPGGRGGADKPPPQTGTGMSHIKTSTDFEKHWKEQNPGKPTMSPEYTAAISKHMKEVPDFNAYA